MKKHTLLLLIVLAAYSCNDKSTQKQANNVSADTTTKKTVTDAPPPGGTIFSLADSFETQKGNIIRLSALQGKPTVMAMIFTNCSYACPRITNDIKNIREKLKEDKNKVNFLLVSFDTERDIPAQLRKFASQMQLDSSWILLHGNEEAVRTLSVLLNVQFQKDGEGNFSHSNLISVLDKNGVLQFQKEGLEADHTETISKIKELLN